MNHDDTTSTTGDYWKWLSRTLVAALIVVAWYGNARAELPNEIRVVTYNIHHGEGLDGKTDLPRIAMVLLPEKPHIVALQAVDQKTGRADGVDQAAALGKLIGMDAVFSRAIDFDGGGYGNAVLTKFPVRSQETVKLKLFTEKVPELVEQRAVQVLELGEKNGAGLMFLCTSLDYRPAAEERMASAQTINELISKRGDTLAILAGTFNAGPSGMALREFAKEWKIAGVDRNGMRPQAEGIGDEKQLRILSSYPADKPRYWVNYVICRPAERWQVVEVRVLDEAEASNHRPVLAVLRRVDQEEHAK